MITIYHLGVSQSDRVVWLMEELGLAYELQWFHRRKDNRLAPDEFLALHPAATAPVIRDGELVLAESPAILEYISQTYADGQLSKKPGEPGYPEYLYWMNLNANLQCGLFTRMAGGAEPAIPALLETVNRRNEGYLNYLNDELGKHDFIVGDSLTCADIMAMWPLTNLESYAGKAIGDYPNIEAYIKRISARPAYQKAQQLAGPGAKPS